MGKSKASLRKTVKQKKIILLVAVGILVIVVATGAWVIASDHKQDKKAVAPVPMNRKLDYTYNPNAMKDFKPPDRAAEIKELESQKNPTYDTYIALAQLYQGQNNKPKAIANYEQAKKVADPKDPMYQSNIAYIDRSIKALKEAN